MNTIFIFLAFLVGKSAAKVALNELIPVCDAKSPNLNACVLKSANLLIPHLSKGIKSYGFPPLDPLKVSRMDISQGNGPITVKLELINTTHVGLSTLRFRSASVDMENNRFVLNGTLPYYSLTGNYKGGGRILLVPLTGNGKANLTFVDTGIDFVINGVPKKGKSQVYFDLISFKVYFKFKESHMQLTNLLGGSNLIGDRASRFLSDNADEVVVGIQDSLEEVYSALYGSLLKRITSNVPYDQFFKNV